MACPQIINCINHESVARRIYALPGLNEIQFLNLKLCNNKYSNTSHNNKHYSQISNIRNTLVSNKIADHLGVTGASPVVAATTTSSFSI